MNTKKTFTIDLTATKSCNFACDYCFEKGQHQNKDMSEETYDKIIEFMKRNDYIYNLMIMGGEPSMAKPLKYFFKRLKEEIENKNIKLELFKNGGNSVYITNGYNINNIYKQLNDIEFWKPYFRFQVSYDGKVIHDKYRKTLNSTKTSEKVLKNFKELYNQGFFTKMKSTINIYDFKHLKDVMEEFFDLALTYNATYDITENKDSFFYINKEEIKDLIDQNFKDVLKFEKKYFEKTQNFFTKWFFASDLSKRTKCSAGVSMFHVNTDGMVQPCHLSIYAPKDRQINYGNIDPLKDNNSLNKKFNEYQKFFIGENEDKCKNCDAVYCTRCPVENYIHEKNLNNLYNGIYHPEDNICFYYQEISKYIFYLKRKLNLW